VSAAAAAPPATASTGALACDLSERVTPGETWRDPSPHRCGYVRWNGLRIHYLDWGGKGPVLIFLPGTGASAHVFDDFAPRFTKRFRVLAITPPGYGESDTPDSSLTVDDVAAAVRAVLDSLHIERAHFAAHSISGAAITRLASRHPKRVGKLIYLDSTFDYTPDQVVIPRLEPPTGGFHSVSDRREWMKKAFGFWSDAIEAEMWAALVSPEETQRRKKVQASLLEDAREHPKEYSEVRSPALSIWALKSFEMQCPWVDRADTAVVARMKATFEARRQWEAKSIERFRREMKHRRVVAFPATHGVFLTGPDRTEREMITFLLHS